MYAGGDLCCQQKEVYALYRLPCVFNVGIKRELGGKRREMKWRQHRGVLYNAVFIPGRKITHRFL